MPDPPDNDPVRQSLIDLHRYLSDEIAPMMAVESMRTLIGQPPKLTATLLRDWIREQYRTPDSTVPVSNYIFHALKKIHLMTEFELIDRRRLMKFLNVLAGVMVKICPESERTELKLQLSELGRTRTTLSAPVRLLHRELGTEEEERALEEEEEAAERESQDDGGEPREPTPGTRRVQYLLNRLEEAGGDEATVPDGEGEGGPAPDNDTVTQILTTAAIESRDGDEFETFMGQLRDRGFAARLDQVFQHLSRNLPGWSVPEPDVGEDLATLPVRAVEAMRKIIAMADSPVDGAQRLGEMLYAAIERFNQGHLAQAVAMFDLAERLIQEKQVDPETVQNFRGQAQGSLSSDALKRFAENRSKHGLLRRVLNFFPSLSPEGLLRSLQEERKRGSRKLILALLEVHGPPCRSLVLKALRSCVTGPSPDDEGFFRRNLLFLLRRIPRTDDAAPAQEIDLLRRCIAPGTPVVVVKEALGVLGRIRDARAEQALIERLKEFEKNLAGGGDAVYDSEDAGDMLDRACAALALQGTRNSFRTITRHAFKEDPALGNAMARIEHLAGQDLSTDPEQLARLVESLRNLLPSKVLGLVVKRNNQDLIHMIRALSGTPAPAVKQALEQIARKYPGQDFADAAGGVLDRFETAEPDREPVVETLSGDLETFGLPELFQSLVGSNATGKLVLTDRKGRQRASLVFVSGMVRTCETGRLQGMEAFFQMFEKPISGSFTLLDVPAADLPPETADGGSIEVLPAVLDAMRRHDEFQMCRALVPDGTMLEPGEAKPIPPSDEADLALVRMVWEKASEGMAPETCESLADTDAYRVRRLYSHWLEQGSLRPRSTLRE